MRSHTQLWSKSFVELFDKQKKKIKKERPVYKAINIKITGNSDTVSWQQGM